MMRLRSIAGPPQDRAQERRAGRARALGVELRPGHAALADEAREAAAARPASRPARSAARRPGRRRSARSSTGAGNAAVSGCAVGRLDVVPAHVRQAARAAQPRDGAGQEAEARGLALLAAREQQLHADAHAEQVRAAAQRRPGSRRRGRARAAPSIAAAACPTPGITTNAARGDLLGPVAHRDLRAGALEGGAQRAQVAGAVVDEAWRSQHALGARDAAARGVGLDRLAQRQRDGLEGRLGDVVVVLAASR